MGRSYVEEFIKEIRRERDLTESTYEDYERILLELVDEIGKDPTDITKGDLLDWRTFQRINKSLSPSALNKRMSIAKQFMSYLHDQGKIDSGEMYRIDSIRPLKDVTPLPRVLTKEQTRKLFYAADLTTDQGIRDAVMLFLLYRAALRVHEVEGLDVGDIQDEYRVLRVWGKGRKEAFLPIVGKGFATSLQHWVENVRPRYAQRGETALLVVMRKGPYFGKRMTSRSIFNRVKRLAQKAGLPDEIACHSLRHSRATHLLEEGSDIRVIQELLRHSHISTTQRYTQVATEALRKELEKYGG